MMLNPTVFLARGSPAFPRLQETASPPARPAARPSTRLVLERRDDGRLWASRGDTPRPVVPRRCFPWSEPGRFISLRDDANAEVALVQDATDLDDGSRRALEDALAAAGFVLEVTRVRSVREEIEIRHWQVETRQGARSFQTRLDDWPRALPAGGVLIRDVAGDLYHIAAPEALDPASRALLWAFVD